MSVVSDSPALPPLAPLKARVLVIEARFYQEIADDLLSGAQATLQSVELVGNVLSVPGALEIAPMMMMALHAADEAGQPYDAAVALGCVIRGETGHYDIVAGESNRALMDLSVALGLPLGNAVLTVENERQARVRAFAKGRSAAHAALTLLHLKRGLPRSRP